jgi:hypothetical protein
MNARMKVYTILSLAVIAALFSALAFAPSAYAFDGRSGDRLVIGKDEVINDDLYLAGEEILVEGTINGDLMAVGEKVTVTGEVTGDLWAAGREVIVNGAVGDDLFAAAAILTLGSTVNVADDVFSAGFSVESQQGSQVGGSLMLGAFQGLVSGDVAEDWLAAASRLRLESTIGGDARIAVNTGSDTSDFQRWMFGTDMPKIPVVPASLTFGAEAQILGSLEYTSSKTVLIPSTVATEVQHLLPPADQQVKEEVSVTREQKNGTTSTLFNGLRRLIALLLVTALLAWLIPSVITQPAAKLQSRPWASLGIGCLGIIAIPMILFFTFGVIALVAILIGALTLGELLGTVLGLGLPALALAAGLFFTMLGYLPQAMVAYLGGRWFFQRVHPQTAEKVIWPVLLGALVLGMLIATPVLGWIIEFFVVLFGLGAIILLVWQRMKKAPEASVTGAMVPPPAVEG